MAQVFIALGSNLGDRAATLRDAVGVLVGHVRIVAVSPLYDTAPVGYSEQPRFLNAVVRGETVLPPLELLHTLKAIERALGRRPSFPCGPREADLDLLLYDDLRCADEQLTLPHPRMHERAFVLRPLADIAPDLVVSGRGVTVAELLARLDTSGVRLYKREWVEMPA